VSFIDVVIEHDIDEPDSGATTLVGTAGVQPAAALAMVTALAPDPGVSRRLVGS
jgi:hypothetical protein